LIFILDVKLTKIKFEICIAFQSIKFKVLIDHI
jgi:hypothetical protein